MKKGSDHISESNDTALRKNTVGHFAHKLMYLIALCSFLSFYVSGAVIAVVGIGGAAYYYFKFIRGKKQKDEDLDFFDDEGYEEEPYINEDNEPDIAEDEETEENN